MGERSQPARISIDVPSVYQKAARVKSIAGMSPKSLRKQLKKFLYG